MTGFLYKMVRVINMNQLPNFCMYRTYDKLVGLQNASVNEITHIKDSYCFVLKHNRIYNYICNTHDANEQRVSFFL